MNLTELQRLVDNAVERAKEFGENPDGIMVTVQIDDADSGASLWSSEVEVCYDNNAMVSGCVLLGVK